MVQIHIALAKAARKTPVYVAITTTMSSALNAKAVNRSKGRVTQQQTKRTIPKIPPIANNGKMMQARIVDREKAGVITSQASVGRKANAGTMARDAPTKTSFSRAVQCISPL